jgi:ferredoxin/flavodoxin---NADP+ reductase
MAVEECEDLRERYYNATVVCIKRVHEELMILRVRPDFPVPTHKPGQYSTLGMGQWESRHPGCQEEVAKPGEEKKLIRRAYSLSSSILDPHGNLLNVAGLDWLEFYVVLVRHTDNNPPALTPRLFLLKEGDRVFLGEKIAGHYTLDPVRPGDAVVLLSTGTGEAPHNYFVWELLHRGHQGPILAACCVRFRRDLGYLAVHEDLMRRYAQYTYLSLTTREADTVDRKVYIQDLISSGQLEQRLGQPLDPERAHVYLCGNPKMIGAPTIDRVTGQTQHPQPAGVIELLEKRQFRMDQPSVKSKGNIHVEEYW